MTHDSVEEHLAELAELVAQAEAMGVDLWPEPKPVRPWAKYALASFMIIMIISWAVSYTHLTLPTICSV